MSEADHIFIKNARQHNLKNIDLNLPKEQLIVITGPSGSGKSSLAFDTLYAEGQRRYIESLSSYARQFIGEADPPLVESITGLSPAIAIDQKSSSKNPRSTVGTITEIYDYLRVFYARLGSPHCPECGKEISVQTPQQIGKTIADFPTKTKIQILSPAVRNEKGRHQELISKFLSLGFSRARIDGELVELSDEIKLEKNIKHNIEIVIDRIIVKDGIERRIIDSVEMALKHSAQGQVIVLKDDEEIFFSERSFCVSCNLSFPQLEPQLFSFNSPIGACSTCNGLGQTKVVNEKLIVMDPNIPILEGGLGVFAKKNTFLYGMAKDFVVAEGFDRSVTYKELSASMKKKLFHGTEDIYSYSFRSKNSFFKFQKEFPGIIPWITKKYRESLSDKTHQELEPFMHTRTCPDCQGEKLNPFALATLIEEKSISQITTMDIQDANNFFQNLKLDDVKMHIGETLLKEIKSRLKFLCEVGLEYLTLNRNANTLSGGESQRIRLATQIGSALTGVLYVLDEPSIGLHSRDNDRLIATLKELRNLKNTVIVVEHDEAMMQNADHLVEIGPGAGIHGGEVTFSGKLKEMKNCNYCLTGQYLSGVKSIPLPKQRRELSKFISAKKITKNNLDKLDVKIPLGGLVAITGVSGSGKSTLIHDALIPAIKAQLSRDRKSLDSIDYLHSVTGVEQIQSIIELDQSPIGRTPHSNPATYTSLFDEIRKLFATTKESKIRGYGPGRFSFNVKGGRCERCEGSGVLKIEMHFLPDVYIGCPDCHGKRYNDETLSVLFKNKNIHEILDMTIEEAYEFFKNHTKPERILATLNAVGLGYMKLGQAATTLSGGEAQRMKLARELGKRPKGHCLYVLDEPTTGLHFEDIRILLTAINSLVDNGHTVLVIEHNMDVIKSADYVIDLGPEGGKKGGKIIAQGTPEDIVAQSNVSFTGKFLEKYL